MRLTRKEIMSRDMVRELEQKDDSLMQIGRERSGTSESNI